MDSQSINSDPAAVDTLPYEVQAVTLLHLLSNPLILYHTVPYLPISSTLSLAATSKSFTDLIHHTPYVFRHLDLRNVKRAQPVNIGRIDRGGQVFRASRCDEGVTEEEFYAGPIRSIFVNLRRRHMLKDVQTLLLDGLSVPADILSEIILDDSYNVRLLSIREVHNLNERKLIQILRYAVRHSRPENTPRLKGLYIFGPKDSSLLKHHCHDSSDNEEAGMSITATIGSSWNQKSMDHLSQSLHGTSEKWYRKSGKMVKKDPLSEWASVLLECKDIISFDAPLCNGPRHRVPVHVKDPKTQSGPWYKKEEYYIPPRVASFALEGCYSCGKCPEGLATFGHCSSDRFPLLTPVPIHSSTVKSAKAPGVTSNSSVQPQILARCQDCLRNRHCENCHKWWCEDCYIVSSKGHNIHPLGMISQQPPSVSGSVNGQSLATEDSAVSEEPNAEVESDHVKGVSRECWDCGLNCLTCSLVTQQRCKICGGGYCKIHNEGSTITTAGRHAINGCRC